MPVTWTIYSRTNCGLCEELLHDLAAVIGPAAAANVRIVDVDTDPALAAKYGRRVPVLLADDEFVCNYRLDEARVRRYLGANDAG